MPGRAGRCRGWALPCGATLSGPPSAAPHRYTCRPAPKTGPHFPRPAPARPAGRAARPGPATSSRGRGPRCRSPRAAMAPGQRWRSGFRPVPRRAPRCGHTEEPRVPSPPVRASLFFPKEAAPRHLFPLSGSPSWSTCDSWCEGNRIKSAGVSGVRDNRKQMTEIQHIR